MQQFTYTIKDKDGVHARPAGALIRAISPLSSDIKLIFNDKTISLKGGIFALLGLAIRFQNEITITVEGDNEIEDLAIVKQALEQNL